MVSTSTIQLELLRNHLREHAFQRARLTVFLVQFVRAMVGDVFAGVPGFMASGLVGVIAYPVSLYRRFASIGDALEKHQANQWKASS